MQIPKELTTVTTLSKTVALIMFITLPIIAFLFGMKYQTMLTEQSSPIPSITISPTSAPVGCTLDAKICPDGSAVGRIPPACEFKECSASPKKIISCGGITGKMCPSGYYCKYGGTYPDASGTCIETIGTKTTYTCPTTEYVDCMPGSDIQKKTECNSAFLQWAQANCPNFKGATR